MPEIRKASSHDIRNIRDLASAALPASFAGVLTTEQIDAMYERLYSQAELQDELNHGLECFIISLDGKDIGCGSFIQRGPDLFLMQKLQILEEYRNRGYGEQLFNALLAEIKAKSSGHALIELSVNSHNKNYPFYIKRGMKKVRDEVLDLGDFILSQDILQLEIG